MPPTSRPGDLPPDIPPEYAEAYRRGFEAAYQRGASEAEAEQSGRQQFDDTAPGRPLAAAMLPGYEEQDDDEDRSRWLVPALLGALALALILGAYGLGKLFSDQVGGSDATAPADGVVVGEDASKSEEDQSKAPEKKDKKKYDGEVQAASIGGAEASCQSDSSVDSAGRPVAYDTENVYDNDPSTAWRCDGSGVGESVTVNLAEKTTIGAVGLIPGYAKTDEQSGADRYAENNRLTRIRWVFSDGTEVDQKLDGAKDNRSMQIVRIPETSADSVTIEILKSTKGPRNTVAISEVSIGAVAG